VEVTPHPLAPLVALAARNDPASPLLAGRLTATYPRAFNEQLLREEIVNYPNQGVQPPSWYRLLSSGHVTSSVMAMLECIRRCVDIKFVMSAVTWGRERAASLHCAASACT